MRRGRAGEWAHGRAGGRESERKGGRKGKGKGSPIQLENLHTMAARWVCQISDDSKAIECKEKFTDHLLQLTKDLSLVESFHQNHSKANLKHAQGLLMVHSNLYLKMKVMFKQCAWALRVELSSDSAERRLERSEGGSQYIGPLYIGPQYVLPLKVAPLDIWFFI